MPRVADQCNSTCAEGSRPIERISRIEWPAAPVVNRTKEVPHHRVTIRQDGPKAGLRDRARPARLHGGQLRMNQHKPIRLLSAKGVSHEVGTMTAPDRDLFAHLRAWVWADLQEPPNGGLACWSWSLCRWKEWSHRAP